MVFQLINKMMVLALLFLIISCTKEESDLPPENFEPLIGIHISELSPAIMADMGINTPIVVDAVNEGSPAFNAEIVKGDIFIKIGDIDIFDRTSFKEALETYSGEKVGALIMRKNKALMREVALR